MKKMIVVVFLLLGMIIVGCSSPEETVSPAVQPTTTTVPAETAQPTEAIQPTETQQLVAEDTEENEAEELPENTKEVSPTATPFDPANWRDIPVIPTVSSRAKEIYQQGQEQGRSLTTFIKVGDCESATDWYLMDFDRGAEFYNLGEYDVLEGVLEQFAGSFERRSVAAERGFRASSILSEFWADPDECVSGETPLSCELRIMNPSIAIITMGTNDVNKIEAFEPGLRRILDELITAGVVPVLATKADNLEGDHSVNEIIAAVALEYEIPLWNYWAAVHELPDGGLQEDGSHLTWAPNFFNDPENMQAGWPVRNLTALQVLDVVWRGCTGVE